MVAGLPVTLVSPCCRAALEGLKCTRCGLQYEAQAGVPVLVDAALRKSDGFHANDRRYQNGAVPWAYDRVAPEVQKYDVLTTTVAALLPSRASAVADVGCSLGLLSQHLTARCDDVTALDLSPSAVARVAERLGPKVTVAAASATALPLPDASLDVVVMSDGLVSWSLGDAGKLAAVREAERVLKPGGHAVFMDYVTPRRHRELVEPVKAVFGIERMIYTDDRLWYVTESMVRVLKGTALYTSFSESLRWSSALKKVSRLLGPAGSKHFGAVVRKPATGSRPDRT